MLTTQPSTALPNGHKIYPFRNLNDPDTILITAKNVYIKRIGKKYEALVIRKKKDQNQKK